MSRPPRQRMGGQAMTEVLVAMIALLPLFMAVTYLGKYGDLQSTANQASRYAAFQRAMQPDPARLSDRRLQDEVSSRFFVPPTAMHGDGRIQSDDAVNGLSARKAQLALWSDLSGKNMLPSLDKVTLTWAAAPLPDPGGLMAAEGALIEHEYTGTRTALVEVELLNRLNLDAARPGTLRLAAATAAAGNGWGSSGTGQTTQSARKAVLAGYVPKGINDILDVALWLFEPTGPDFGCIQPDITPAFRLKGKGGTSECKF